MGSWQSSQKVTTQATSATDLASLLLIPDVPGSFESQIAQLEHRQQLIKEWGGIAPGSKVLELGCGHGDCTVVIADLVGENGRVDGVDPAPPDFGRPFTVKQAREHISASRLGPRIKWIIADPLDFLNKEHTEEKSYDLCILAHSLWYFYSPEVISRTLRRLGPVCKRILVAEWALSSPLHNAQPHIFSVLTSACLQSHIESSKLGNIRTAVSPGAILKLAEGAGLKLVSESTLTPIEGLKNGKWETMLVSHKIFVEEIETYVKDGREKSVVYALRDTTLKNLSLVNGGVEKVRSMDVWCAVFEKA